MYRAGTHSFSEYSILGYMRGAYALCGYSVLEWPPERRVFQEQKRRSEGSLVDFVRVFVQDDDPLKIFLAVREFAPTVEDANADVERSSGF